MVTVGQAFGKFPDVRHADVTGVTLDMTGTGAFSEREAVMTLGDGLAASFAFCESLMSEAPYL